MATPKNSSTHAAAASLQQPQFPAVEAAGTLALFGTPERKAVEKLISDKNGRPVIRCQVRHKDVPAKAEEIVRQLWL
ncbi:MAG TPA: hypothetical protein VIO38_04515 [Rariglobus sp.]